MQESESVRKPSRIRAIGIAAAGLIAAGAAGLTMTGIATASAAESHVVSKAPTQEDPYFVTRGHADGTEPTNQATANNEAAYAAMLACEDAGFKTFEVNTTDVFQENDGYTVIYHGRCIRYDE